MKNLKEQKKYLWFDIGYTLLRLKRDVSFQQILKEMGISLSTDEMSMYLKESWGVRRGSLVVVIVQTLIILT